MSEELIPHVTAEGEWIEWVTRSEIHARRLIHRSIHVLVFHPDGRLLVQLRHRDKQTFARYWDVSCSGHVEFCDHPDGEGGAATQAFSSSATREISEELGISPPLQFIRFCPPIEGVNYEFAALYRATSEGPFTLQAEEVEEVRWVNAEEVKLLKITPNLQWLLDSGLIWAPSSS